MDNREQIAFSKLIQSLDAPYGKNTPKSIATIRVAIGKTVKVLFKNPDAKIHDRLLIDRLTGDARKVRMFLEPDDVVCISSNVGDLVTAEYYRAEMGERNVILTSIAGPSLDEYINQKHFAVLSDHRKAIATRTLSAAIATLTGLERVNLLLGLTTIGGVNLIFDSEIPADVHDRCLCYAPAEMVWAQMQGVSDMVLHPYPNFKDLKAVEMPDNYYLVFVDSEKFSIRVLCHPDNQYAILKKLKAAKIYSRKIGSNYKILIDPSNDLANVFYDH